MGGIDTRVEETQLDVRRQVGLVLQNPDNQLVAGVVEEDVVQRRQQPLRRDGALCLQADAELPGVYAGVRAGAGLDVL